jgi:hypothetical protein
VDTTLAARLPLEMFDRVGDVALRTVDPDHLQGPIQYLACWSDKGLPDLIFLIARLFANKDDDPFSTFTEHRLSRVPKQRTGLTFCELFCEVHPDRCSPALELLGRSPLPSWSFSSFLIKWQGSPALIRAPDQLWTQKIASSFAAEYVEPKRRGSLEKRARRQDRNLDGRDFARA